MKKKGQTERRRRALERLLASRKTAPKESLERIDREISILRKRLNIKEKGGES